MIVLIQFLMYVKAINNYYFRRSRCTFRNEKQRKDNFFSFRPDNR